MKKQDKSKAAVVKRATKATIQDRSVQKKQQKPRKKITKQAVGKQSMGRERRLLLTGLEVLFLDCLRHKPHHTHINVEQSVAYACQIAAASTYLIHMTHELEYEALGTELPDNVHVGYDGLRLKLL